MTGNGALSVTELTSGLDAHLTRDGLQGAREIPANGSLIESRALTWRQLQSVELGKDGEISRCAEPAVLACPLKCKAGSIHAAGQRCRSAAPVIHKLERERMFRIRRMRFAGDHFPFLRVEAWKECVSAGDRRVD